MECFMEKNYKTLKYEVQKIFDNVNYDIIMKDIQLVECMKSEASFIFNSQVVDLPVCTHLELTVSGSLCCSYCQASFKDQSEQRNHYKLDWHRHNLKRSLKGLSFLTEEEFSNLADDVSSISGSESETSNDDITSHEEDLLDFSASSLSLQKQVACIRHPKVFFVTKEKKVVSLYRCVLHGKEDAPDSPEKLLDLAKSCPKHPKWAILMIGGGHFAAAIYEGNTVLLHKTFHSYTVRARQGGSQSSRDSRSGTNHPKSAGASLRRYNEMSFQQHIQGVLEAWSTELEKCHIIFLRAVSHNRSLIFTGKSSPIKKSDTRIRNIPFPTRRATFNEVKRIHGLLCSLELYGSIDEFVSALQVSPHFVEQDSTHKNFFITKSSTTPPSSPEKKRSQCSNKKIDRGKPRVSPCRQLPQIVESLAALSSSDEDSTTELVELFEVTDLRETLQEFDNNVSQEEEKEIYNSRKRRSKKKVEKSMKNRIEEKPAIPQFELGAAALEWSARLMSVCHDTELIKDVLGEKDCSKVSDIETIVILNQPIDTRHNTMLHLAASQGLPDRVRLLLEIGVDPARRNLDKKTPFKVAKDWETKKAFRRFQADFPHKYDYKKADIPGGLTAEAEQEEEAAHAERKKAQRRAKKERFAEKKKAEAQQKKLDEEQRKFEEEQKKEQEERNRFLNLSDREKRALAAERRLLASGGNIEVRCFLCGCNMTGQVPFSYQTFSFCSMPCLKAHRFQNPKQL